MEMRKQIRAEREQAVYAQARRRKEVFWNTVTFLVILVLFAGFGGLLYLALGVMNQ
jgi:NhaP-type Na+/H+ or K+/H+ antiporter